MIAVKSDGIHSYYDRNSDDLTVKLGYANSVYSDEVFDDIYLIRDEKDDKVVAFQILYLKRRSDYVLRKYLPSEVYRIVQKIKNDENIKVRYE